MDYVEQLKLQQEYQQQVNKILEQVPAEDFINYYKTHTKQETKALYNIKTDRQLKRILTAFNYDFSFKKGLNKGKPAARAHESYVVGGKKSATTQKQHWQEKSDEEKEAWSAKQKQAHNSAAFRQKIKQINLDYQASLTPEQKLAIKQKRAESNKNTWDVHKQEILAKEYQTKKANKSFNTSKPEDCYYELLIKQYGSDAVIRQYHDIRYPHNCDFYIKPLDLFIELNLNWTHGGHRFDGANPADQAKLAVWQEKAKTSDFYKKAIHVWTCLDVSKYEDAIKNNLNYKVYYLENELYNLPQKGSKDN